MMPEYAIADPGGDNPSRPEVGKKRFSMDMDWPFTLGETAISPDGTMTDRSRTEMSGFTIREAGLIEAALPIAKACLFLNIFGSLEVSALMPMPHP